MYKKWIADSLGLGTKPKDQPLMDRADVRKPPTGTPPDNRSIRAAFPPLPPRDKVQTSRAITAATIPKTTTSTTTENSRKKTKAVTTSNATTRRPSTAAAAACPATNGKVLGPCQITGCRWPQLELNHHCCICRAKVHNFCVQEHKLNNPEDELKMYCSTRCKQTSS